MCPNSETETTVNEIKCWEMLWFCFKVFNTSWIGFGTIFLWCQVPLSRNGALGPKMTPLQERWICAFGLQEDGANFWNWLVEVCNVFGKSTVSIRCSKLHYRPSLVLSRKRGVTHGACALLLNYAFRNTGGDLWARVKIGLNTFYLKSDCGDRGLGYFFFFF